jgi:hypothetical protein
VALVKPREGYTVAVLVHAEQIGFHSFSGRDGRARRLLHGFLLRHC